ncbi:stage II sporulation protein P [Paenibacillus sp. MBLB4367]|uniref:stage II sporulation protein P n=1 Tax=Paenibacillus sp. MBLB4367 TaxID=3384767 RepID=UPI003907FA96
MKWSAFMIDVGKFRKMIRSAGYATKLFGILFITTFLFFVGIGVIGYVQTKVNASPVSSMRGVAASVSSDFFMDMLSLEVPHLRKERTETAFSQQNVIGFVFRMLTDINLRDPKTMLAREVPGLGRDNAVLLRKGPNGNSDYSPEDYPPANEAEGMSANGSQQPGATPSPSVPSPSAETPHPSASPSPSVSPDSQAKPTTGGKKVVLIYHSHNRESFLPHLAPGLEPSEAYDSKTNVTLVGKRLEQKLNDLGIGSIDYSPDYSSTEKGYNFNYSYKYSQKTVKEAFAANPDISFVFDLHRDSGSRKATTVSIDGKDYARTFFIIGQKNPNWKKNEKFAASIHEKLEQKLPGISNGIWGKTQHDGQAEYNQSLSPNSVLIEIGGPYNTLEECYRTADELAKIIAELYWDAEKVNAPPQTALAK